MTVRLATHELVGLLTDLALTTADPTDSGATAGILLHTARGYLGDQPGAVDLLVGTSSNGVAVGHAHTGCGGQAEPMVWSIGDARAVIGVFKPFAKDKDHAVEIALDGVKISVAEDPDLFGERLAVSFTGGAVADYPAESVRDVLAAIRMSPPDDDPPAAPRTDMQASVLAPFLKVAARRNTMLEIYRYHQRLPVVVQIGPRYRGVALPFRWDSREPDAGMAPSGDVYPLLPDTH